MNNLSGQNIKGYELQERIGAGGFGAVYRAYQSTVGREVAIKVILPGRANQPDFIRRFEGEAQLIARLEHHHIVPLYDYWRDPDGAYLVMRWLRGGSLLNLLQSEGALSIEEAVTMMDQITQALHTAHRSHVIHRDIKPGNILLDEDGNAFLADFGIAKDQSVPVSVTDADAIVGSPDYLAPEQARSEPVTPQTDVYSLGVVLYEMLEGQHPFPGLTPIERLYKHLKDPLPPLTKLDDSICDDINAVIQTATAKDPKMRFKDVLALAQALRDAAVLESGQATTSLVELLTPREQEVLQLIIDGHSNREIADELVLTVSTVKTYVNRIYRKLNVRSRVQAIVKARELDLIVNGVHSAISTSISFLPEPENPYKGLRAFQVGDEHDYFGREKLIGKLLKRLQEDVENKRFLAIVGPSGSGKSSVVRAGLIPALWRGEIAGSDKWFIVDMLPGSRPLDELEVALLRISGNHGLNLREQLERDAHGLLRVASLILPEDESELLLVIDQFEEVFTLLESEEQRQHFLNLLNATITDPRSRVRVVITLRADYYDRPLHYTEFGELMRTRVETVLPLGAEELERAIRQPAASVGVRYADGLISRIVSDVNYQPGGLPLLQYALTELFERRNDRIIKLSAYEEIGGTGGALAKRADEIFLEYDEPSREVIRQLFLRLVTLGEGAEDTRRRVQRSELLSLAGDDRTELMDEIIDEYAMSRLLSLDHDPASRRPTVEVAHEAILREWDRLRQWLNESRDDIRRAWALSRAAGEWNENNRDVSFLLRGAHLEHVEKWQEATRLVQTPLEQEFIARSLQQRDQEAQIETERQERETSLERRAQKFMRGLIAVLLMATLGASGLAGIAINQRNIANRNEAEARSFGLASSAQLALNEGNTEHAISLAKEALEIGDNSLAQRVLAEASFGTEQRSIFRVGDNFVPYALTADDSTLKLVVVSHIGRGHPFGEALVNGMEDACAELNVSCQWLGAWGTGWGNIAKHWDEALEMEPDGIGTTIGDPEVSRDYVQQAVESGIPLIAFNVSRGLDNSPSVPAQLYIGSDEFVSGQTNARRIFEEANADGRDIKRGVCTNQAQGYPPMDARCAGVKSVFDEHDVPLDVIPISLCEEPPCEDPPELEAVRIADYFSSHPEANALFILGPDPAHAFNLYIEQTGLEPGQLYATSHDTSPEIFQMIQDGYFLQTIDQQPYMQGYQTILSLYLYRQYGLRPSGFINTSSVIDQSNVANVIQLTEMGYR